MAALNSASVCGLMNETAAAAALECNIVYCVSARWTHFFIACLVPWTVRCVVQPHLGTILFNHMQQYGEQLHQSSFFIEDEVYWAPASSKTALYSQLSEKKYREILRQQIK